MANILIVDDTPINIAILKRTLQDTAHNLYEAENGSQALKLVQIMRFDLILLDVMMPNMDGFEVCKRLRENPNTAEVPVIFVTALHEDQSRVKGFDVGGNDYITKPFYPDEVVARVNTHIDLYLKRQELERINRQEQKFFNEINAIREDLLAQLRHDVKSPISSINTMAYIIRRRVEDEDIQRYAHSIEVAAFGIIDLIENLLELIKLETGRLVSPQPIAAADFFKEVIQSYEVVIESNDLVLSANLDELASTIICKIDAAQIRRVMDNLLSNAIKYTPSGGTVSINFRTTSEILEVEVKDTGSGIRSDELERIFDRFYRVSEDDHEGTGLGLYIVKQIILQHNGTVSAKSQLGQGTTFTITLPLRSTLESNHNEYALN